MADLPEPKDVTPEIAGSKTVGKGNPISNNKNVNYSVGAHEHLGKVVINGNTAGPVGKFDFVALYTSEPPSNPNSKYLTYLNVVEQTSYKTGYDWGSGYWVAYGSYDYRAGRYVKVVQAGPT